MSREQARHDPQITEAEENFLIDFQFLIQDLIDSKRITRTELAKRTGISKARLTQILSAEANPTVKTVARLFYALNAKVALQSVSEPREILLSPNRAEVGSEWKVDKDLNASVAEQRHVKSKTRHHALLKEWLGASNDNYVVIASDARVRMKAVV